MKRAEISVSFFRICAELWVAFEEACRITDTSLGKCGKNCQEEKRILRFEDFFCTAGIWILFINFEYLWAASFQILADLWVNNVKQNGTSSYRIWLN